MKRSDVPSSKATGNPGTSPTLMARIRSGDPEGWERFVRLYGPLVYSWCRRAGLSEEDAGDVSQDVFTTLTTKLDQFRSDRPGDSFRRWLKTITNNRARDLHRRQKDKPKARGGSEAHREFAAHVEDAGRIAWETETAEPESERIQEFNHLLRTATELVRTDFEPKTWQAFWETVVEGRKTADVAADFGLSAGAVRIAKSRVRARLRQELAGLLDEP